MKNRNNDKIKERFCKLMIIVGLFATIGNISLYIVLFALQLLKNQEIFKIWLIISMLLFFIVAPLSMYLLFKVGNTIKTANVKDFKIMKYNCSICSNLKERFIEVFTDNIKMVENSKLLYSLYIKGSDLKEIVIIIYYPVDRSFNENRYCEDLSKIPEINEEYWLRTIIVIFEQIEESKYVYDILHYPQYGTATERTILCEYNKELKILLINKTKTPLAYDKTYFLAKKELDKIFNLTTRY